MEIDCSQKNSNSLEFILGIKNLYKSLSDNFFFLQTKEQTIEDKKFVKNRVEAWFQLHRTSKRPKTTFNNQKADYNSWQLLPREEQKFLDKLFSWTNILSAEPLKSSLIPYNFQLNYHVIV